MGIFKHKAHARTSIAGRVSLWVLVWFGGGFHFVTRGWCPWRYGEGTGLRFHKSSAEQI